MFSFIRTLISVIILLLIAALFFFWSFRIPITSKVLTHLFKTEVTIQDLDISLSLSRLTVRGLKIKSPAPTKNMDALRVGYIEVKASPFTFFKKNIVIKDVYADHLYLFVDMYNTTGSQNNWATIINNLSSPSDDTQKESGKTFEIKHILFEDVVFAYQNPSVAGVQTLDPIKKVQFKNIGSQNPGSAQQIITFITRTLLSHFAKTAGFNAIMNNLPLMPFKFGQGSILLIDDTPKELKKLIESTGKDASKGFEKFKNFFKGSAPKE